MRASWFTVLSRRIRRHEEGFSLLEVVVAMGVILLSLTMLASTALVGFTGAATARQRQTATALAEQVVEQVRGLPFDKVAEGLNTADIAADTRIVTCGTEAKCFEGETLVHSTGASTAPLVPHQETLGPPTYPDTFTRSIYVTEAADATDVYRLTVEISWTSGGRKTSVSTQTLLSNPTGTGDSSTQVGSGGSTASFYGSAGSSPGSVVITPNGNVYNGVGITGLSSSVWNLGDSVSQAMYSLDAEVTEGQIVKVGGRSNLTFVQKSISGSTCISQPTHCSGGTNVFSAADSDATTAEVGTSDPTVGTAPTPVSQVGPSLTLSGGGNSLTLNGYTQTTTTSTAPGNTTFRSSSRNRSSTASVSVTAPAGMIAGDFLIAQLSYETTTTSTCMSTPSGWVLIRCDVNGTNPRVWSAVYGKAATAADVTAGSFSFATNASSGVMGAIIAYSGVDTSNLPSSAVDFSTHSTGTSTTASTPAVSGPDIETSNARQVAFFTARGDTTVTPSQPGSGTSSWAQVYSDKGGAPTGTQRNYLTNAPALSTTAGSGTRGPIVTNSDTFVLAGSFERTISSSTELAGGSNSWPLQVSVNSTTSNYNYFFRLVRQNSAGVPQATSGDSTTWSNDGTKSYTFTWDAGTWASGDKLVVEWWHRRSSGNGDKSGTINTTNLSYVDAPTGGSVGVAGANGLKQPPGAGNGFTAWSASLSQSAMWIGQMIVLYPGNVTTTSTTTGTAGTESGSTVSTTAAVAVPACGSPVQTDIPPRACSYAAHSYAVPQGVDNAFLATTVSLSGYGIGTCPLYTLNPPSSNPTSYAYARRAATSSDGTVVDDTKRYYGTHTFGSLCSGTGKPSGWPGYFVKFDAGTSASQAIAQAGVSSTGPTASSAGTIYVWNGSGTTQFAVPTSGLWSTSPTAVDYTTGGYRYQISAILGSRPTFTTQLPSTASGTMTRTEAKAVVGSPVVGTISYKLTDQTNNRVLIDVTISVDLGTLTSYAKYTEKA